MLIRLKARNSNRTNGTLFHTDPVACLSVVPQHNVIITHFTSFVVLFMSHVNFIETRVQIFLFLIKSLSATT